MSPGRSWLARDLLPSVAVGFLVFHLVRTHLVERYRVTSRSMEPTLHGDPEVGDVVLVDRTAWRIERPRAWDLVVIRNRDNPGDNHLVKRLLAIGPGDVELREGDVFFGHGNALDRLRKHPVVHRDMRVTHALFDPASGATDTGFLENDAANWSRVGNTLSLTARATAWEALRTTLNKDAQDRRRLEGGVRDRAQRLPFHLGLLEPVDASFVDGGGRLDPSGGPRPRDIGLELDLECTAGLTGIHLVHEHAETYFGLELDLVDRTGRFTMFDRELDRFTLPLASGETTSRPWPLRLEFGYLDGRHFLVQDGTMVWERDVALPRQARLLLDREGRFANLLHVGVTADAVGPGVASVQRLRVFRDPHYAWDVPPGRPFRLEVDQIFVVGDNAYDSADSRSRLYDPFDVADLIGRPIAILGPDRRRWLERYPTTLP